VRASVRKPDAARELEAHLHTEQNSSVRSACFDALVDIATADALMRILHFLRSNDIALRNSAITAAQRLPHQIAPAIEALLSDPDAEQRLFGVRLLEELPHPCVQEWIAGVLSKETDPIVAAAALDVVAECVTEDMLKAVTKVRQRFADSDFVCFAADFVLSRLTTAKTSFAGGTPDGK